MSIRFVIDESSWRFDQMTPLSCSEALDQLLDQIELALEQGHGVCYSEELFHQRVWQEKMFYDLLDPDCGFHISREISERLSSIIYKLPMWQDLPAPQAVNAEIQINSKLVQAASIVWAAQQTLNSQNNAVAALILPTCHAAGCHTVSLVADSVSVWLVAERDSYQGFFRWLILTTSKNPAELAQWAHSAFLQLDFYADALSGIKSMEKPYKELVGDLVRHLAALSDHGKAIFSQNWEDAPARFGQYGVDMSMENGKTKRNKDARDDRTKIHNGKEVVFWWHSKLERHQNRIHFYPNDAANTGRILVGIFCKHLRT